MEQQVNHNYSKAIQLIKSAILKSRYRAAALANRELLSLYFNIGEYISHHSRIGTWGTGALAQISKQLQAELPGLRGFSATNLKNMRLFYEAWVSSSTIRQLSTDELEKDGKSLNINFLENRQLITDDLEPINMNHFLHIGFTHHIYIINNVKTLDARLFYIERCAMEFWSVEKLKYNLKSNLYEKQGKLPNNFKTTISDIDLQRKALLSFKDEYLLDYINIESPDDEPDERVLESAIMNNIRKFIMSLGKDFSFIGNQYRLIVEEQEYFIDLLFFNRQLQSLVALELLCCAQHNSSYVA